MDQKINNYEQYQALTKLMDRLDPLSGEWHGLAVARDDYRVEIRRGAVEDCLALLRQKLDELDPQDHHAEWRAVTDSIRRIEGRLL